MGASVAHELCTVSWAQAPQLSSLLSNVASGLVLASLDAHTAVTLSLIGASVQCYLRKTVLHTHQYQSEMHDAIAACHVLCRAAACTVACWCCW
jgi:hypothetical protein